MAREDQPRPGFFQQLDVEYLVHELKDPIAVIETGARMLLERQDARGRLTPLQERTVQRVLRNTIKAREMLYGLLEVGRAEAGCQESVAFAPAPVLVDLIADILSVRGDRVYGDSACPAPDDLTAPETLMAAHDVHLILSDADRQMSVCLDRVKFEQIIGNLIRNGLDYRKRRLEVNLTTAADRFSVAVADDGPGIPTDLHEAVFKRYTRLKTCEPLARQGHGLGLAGSRVLARAMGGDIEIISRPGNGAVFTVCLPLAAGGCTCPPLRNGLEHPTDLS